MAGAPKGNNNATKSRRWAQAIDKALKQYNEGDVEKGFALDAIAKKLVKQAIQGDSNEFKEAFKEIGDRIDGKALASIELSGELQISDLTDAEIDKRIRELDGD